ncbi:hypothetical protein [Synechococcus phage S-H34]|nr:hypothetical protein PQC15_gp094 [Synechococcus phage S-H34]QIN96965.1 hypothetical protein [Synechococcus phage S-H34]
MEVFLIHLFFLFMVTAIMVVAIPEAFVEPVKEAIWGFRAIFGPANRK